MVANCWSAISKSLSASRFILSPGTEGAFGSLDSVIELLRCTLRRFSERRACRRIDDREKLRTLDGVTVDCHGTFMHNASRCDFFEYKSFHIVFEAILHVTTGLPGSQCSPPISNKNPAPK